MQMQRSRLPISLGIRFYSALRQWPLSAALFVFLGFTALAPALWAQTTSTINGNVTDRQGLAISGAEVRLGGSTVAFSKSSVTDANGRYEIAGIPAGTYSLTVSHAGFATQVLKDLEITLNRTVVFNVTLELGTVQQRLEVLAETPLLETTSSSVGKTIAPQEIEDMPINGRNYLDLLQLVPGVAINRQADA